MRGWTLSLYLVLVCLSYQVSALKNDQVLTPPMGWFGLLKYRCNTDCKKYPRECLSESLIKRTVDALVQQGYREAGYTYVGISDCWSEKQRGKDGRLVPDRQRFPNGMKAIADYIHKNNLKFALYQDYGTKTCAGYPGVLGSEQLDVKTFAEWEIDYLKLDGCNVDVKKMDQGYPSFGKLLSSSGRNIAYACDWPAYQEKAGIKPNYANIAASCNVWSNVGDIDDNWKSLTSIMDWVAANQNRITTDSGRGSWNDPGVLAIGNPGLNVEQAKVQMAVWTVLAAPLFISADLQTIKPEFKKILLNKQIIAINQDPMGRQGKRIIQNTKLGYEVWWRELLKGYVIAAFVNRGNAPVTASFGLQDLILDTYSEFVSYRLQDLFDQVPDLRVDTKQPVKITINPKAVKFYKIVGA